MDGLKPYLGDAKVLIVVNPVDVMTRVAVESSALPPGRGHDPR
jgi:malate/lactate dehydrogenase